MLTKLRLSYFFTLGSIILLSLACNFTGNPSISSPSDQLSPVVEASSISKPDPEPDPEPDPGPGQLNLPQQNGADLKLSKSYFNQDKNVLTSVFELENVNSDKALTEINYLVHAYDTNGTELGTDAYFIESLHQGEKTTVVSELWLSEGEQTGSVTLDWEYRLGENINKMREFQAHLPRVLNSEFSGVSKITGILSNSSPDTIIDIRVDAVGYNSTGEIVGGGLTTITFVPGNKQVGFKITGYFKEEPTSIIFFPRKTYLTTMNANTELDQNLIVVDSNYALFDSTLGGGYIISNNGNQAISRFDTYLTIYDQDGTTCEVLTSEGNHIFSGETTGISSGPIFLPPACNYRDFELFFFPLETNNLELFNNPLKAENATYISSANPMVTLNISNSYSKSISETIVYVLLFNEAGEIINGGFAFPDPIPGNGSVDVEVYLSPMGEEEPAYIEAYPVFTTWTSIGD